MRGVASRSGVSNGAAAAALADAAGEEDRLLFPAAACGSGVAPAEGAVRLACCCWVAGDELSRGVREGEKEGERTRIKPESQQTETKISERALRVGESERVWVDEHKAGKSTLNVKSRTKG